MRNLLWILPLGLLLSAPLWQDEVAEFLRPRGGYDAAAEEAHILERQDFVMDGVILTMNSNGEQTWKIKARQARTGRTDREILLQEVDAVYRRSGYEPLTVSSKEGIYQIDAKHLTLIEDVVLIKPSQQEELYTELLYYDDTTKLMTSPVEVEIKTPTLDLQAGGMEYNLSTESYIFSQRVKALTL
jgi:LPS export ABC transporter protein LptC